MRSIPIFLSFCVLAASSVAEAQVNAERLRAKAKTGFSGSTDIGFKFNTGNDPYVSVSGDLRLQYAIYGTRTSTAAPMFLKELFYMAFDGNYKEKKGHLDRDRGFLHLRWTKMYLPRFGSEVFAQWQRNRIIQLKRRIYTGAGVRVGLLRSKIFRLYWGAAAMVEFEWFGGKYNRQDVYTEKGIIRGNTYLSIWWNLPNLPIHLTNVTYAQPRFNDFGDTRFVNDLEIVYDMTRHFSLVARLLLEWDTRPPDGVEGFQSLSHGKLRFRF